ncbi:MAG TPA: transglutaminaseTgpA domain-containing protein [Stenomitos sp.]
MRLSLGGKGQIVLLMGAFAFLAGTVMHLPILNLCGYFLLATLVTAMVIAFLELRGVTLQAALGTRPEPDGQLGVWVRLGGDRKAGPFGLSATKGRRWGRDRLVMAPEPAGYLLGVALDSDHAPKRLRVRLRSFPLGMVSVSLVRSLDLPPLEPRPEEAAPAPVEGHVGQEPFGGLREHRPGEGIRDVHWVASARKGQLVVRLREPEAEPRQRPRHQEPPTPALPPERRLLLHVATCLASQFAILFTWSLGTLTWPVAIAASLLHGTGSVVSARRGGRPGWPLLLLLYAGVLGALLWFLFSLRRPAGTPPPMAPLLVSVIAVFAWDLRNRLYLRAQQLNAFLVLAVTPALSPGKDTPWMGAAFLGAALALLVASWADGRHEMGARAVTLRDLKDLPSAWLPIAVLSVLAVLVQPLLPPMPLPPLPTFGYTPVANQVMRDGATRLPGEGGVVTLNARWPESSDPVIRVYDDEPRRLRTEVFSIYREGSWYRAARHGAAWPRGATADKVRLMLMVHGMRTLPLPESALGVEGPAVPHTLYAGQVLEMARPVWRGFDYLVRLPAERQFDEEPPTRVDASTLGLPSELGGLASRLSEGARSPRERMSRLSSALQHVAQYDLNAPQAPAGVDPTVFFLTSSHRGFCMHFASALALMGRELGVPTRLVAGYNPGKRKLRFTVVEEGDAHAWVEAYLDGHWEPFDPTPVGIMQRDRLAWPRLGGLGLVLVALVILAWVRRPRVARVTLEFQRALRRLARRGIPVREATSPREALELAKAVLEPAEQAALQTLVARYEAERFGARRS